MYFSTVIRLSLFLQLICGTRIQTWNQMSVFWFSILTNDQQSFKCSLILKHCDWFFFPCLSRTNSCNNQFPVCLRAKLVRALQRYILRRSGLEEWSFFAEIFSGFLLLVMFSTEMIFSTFIIFLSRS